MYPRQEQFTVERDREQIAICRVLVVAVRSGEGPSTTHLRPPEVISGMAEKGVIRPITDACTYGEVAPIPAIRAAAIEPPGSTRP